MHLDLAFQIIQCSLSMSSVARGFAVDLTAYLEGIVTQQ